MSEVQNAARAALSDRDARLQQRELALQIKENENIQLLSRQEEASRKAQELARQWQIERDENRSSGSDHFMDMSSGSVSSQPGTLAQTTYMNVFWAQTCTFRGPDH